jgi:predicted anti-sigma-YlaC factor YlaD
MCERAREWASLRLDDELSELERVLLDAHLGRCSECAGYVADIGAVTREIRTAELVTLPQPIALPLRRRLAFANRALQAGAAAAAVVAVSVGLGVQSGSGKSTRDLVANAVRMPESAISSGPNTEGDALVRVPRLANLKAQQGVGRQRGLRIGTS